MKTKTQNGANNMSIEFMRTLKARGYTVTRAGLNFRVVTAIGAVSLMTLLELESLAKSNEGFIL